MAKTTAPQPAEHDDAVLSGTKGRATPSRKEQEAARLRPLVPTDRRAASKQSRAQLAEQRDRARVGMANGEERYLPLRDKGPQKRYVRDYIDARFSIGEILLPLLVLVIVGTFFEAIAVYLFIAVYGVLAIVILEAIIVNIFLRRRMTAKFGAGKVEKVGWYATMRMVQMRMLRLPKPQVKRGQFPS